MSMLNYRANSIILADGVLVISSIMCLSNLIEYVTFFEKCCFFLTIVIIILEHKILESFYISDRPKKTGCNKRLWNEIFVFTKYVSFSSFIVGLYSILFIN